MNLSRIHGGTVDVVAYYFVCVGVGVDYIAGYLSGLFKGAFVGFPGVRQEGREEMRQLKRKRKVERGERSDLERLIAMANPKRKEK